MIRRDFLSTLTAAPALAGALGAAVRGGDTTSPAGVITASALAYDAVALAAYASEALSKELKRALVRRLDVVVLGRLLDGRADDVPRIVAGARGKKLDPAGEAAQRAALAAGSAVYRAAVKHMGPLEGERAIHRDAAVLRSYTPAAPTFDAATIENVLEVLDRRLFVFVHTVEPDEEDVWGWLDRVADWHDAAAARRRVFAAAYATPDAAKMGANFLAVTDALLQTARAVGRGEQAPRKSIAGMLESASKQSLYTRALADAYRGIEELGRQLA